MKWIGRLRFMLQAFEGIALGATFVRAKFATLKYVIFMIIYSLVSSCSWLSHILLHGNRYSDCVM